jgi:hypothetical protein
MARKRQKFEITFEYIEGKDSKQRLKQAFEMLFRDLPSLEYTDDVGLNQKLAGGRVSTICRCLTERLLAGSPTRCWRRRGGYRRWHQEFKTGRGLDFLRWLSSL